MEWSKANRVQRERGVNVRIKTSFCKRHASYTMREIAKLVLLVIVASLASQAVSAEWTIKRDANDSQVAQLSFDAQRTSRISIPCVSNQSAIGVVETVFWYKLFRSGVERFYTADANIDLLLSNASKYMVRRTDQLYFDDSQLSRVIVQPNGSLVIENARLFVCGTWHCFRLCNQSQSDSSQCSYAVQDAKTGSNLWLAHVSQVDINVQVLGFQHSYAYSLLCAVGSAGVTFVSILLYSIVITVRNKRKQRRRRAQSGTAKTTDTTDASASHNSSPSSSHDDASGDVRVGCDAFNLLDLLLLADVHHDAHRLREKLVLLRERFHSRLGNFKFPHSANCWSSNERADVSHGNQNDSDTLTKVPPPDNAPLSSAVAVPDRLETSDGALDAEIESLQLLTAAASNLMPESSVGHQSSAIGNDLQAAENGEEKIEIGNEEDLLAEAAQRGAWNLHRAWKSLMHRHGASIKIKRKKSGEYHFHPIEFLKRFETYKAKANSSKKSHSSKTETSRDPDAPSTSRD